MRVHFQNHYCTGLNHCDHDTRGMCVKYRNAASVVVVIWKNGCKQWVRFCFVCFPKAYTPYFYKKGILFDTKITIVYHSVKIIEKFRYPNLYKGWFMWCWQWTSRIFLRYYYMLVPNVPFYIRFFLVASPYCCRNLLLWCWCEVTYIRTT